jgi:DNA-binding NarL/FixJ family response regulator
MTRITVLLVDDYAPFRRLLCVLLEDIPGVQIIGEASDGLEAVQKAEALHPDLILLDIGLPKLSGIQAAKKIVNSVPDSKIVFLSQETSDDIVEEAFRLGAFRYLGKVHAGTEVEKAVEAVRLAKLSTRLNLGIA